MEELHDFPPESRLLLWRSADPIPLGQWTAASLPTPLKPSDVAHPLGIGNVSTLDSFEEGDALSLTCNLCGHCRNTRRKAAPWLAGRRRGTRSAAPWLTGRKRGAQSTRPGHGPRQTSKAMLAHSGRRHKSCTLPRTAPNCEVDQHWTCTKPMQSQPGHAVLRLRESKHLCSYA